MLAAGKSRFDDSIAGVQVRPVGGDLETPGFGRDQGAFVGLSGG